MTTNSYLEYFLTLLGWVINNGLWNVLLGTGLFAAPLAFKVVGIWLKVREEGEDEGNKGMLSLPRIENALYGAFFVMIACCVPLVNVSLDTIAYDESRAKTCGTWTPKAPEDSGYSNVISSLNGQTAAAPIWWVLVHKLSKGTTQAAVATIPCRPDLRQLRFEVQHTRLNNKALAAELQDFTNDCYSLALYMWKQKDQGQTTDKTILRDIEWLGSKTFQKGYYGELQSKTPRANFPWNASRDSGRPNTGLGGYPTCSEWWNSGDAGLESRVVNQADPGMWLRLSAAMKMIGVNSADYKETVIRRLVSPESLTVSQGGHAYAGYGGNADFTLDNSAARLGAVAGNSLASLAAFPAFDSMRQALPMVQAILLMAICVMLPLILAFSAYEFKTAITLTFIVFALNFLTFWWELARWLDSWILTALYSSDTHSRFNMAGFQNTTDDLIMNLVMGTMFIVLPAVWMGALSWAGIRTGGVIEGAISNGTKKAQEGGGKGADVVTNAALSGSSGGGKK
ncbi:TPA: conjugal transfer protein TraG N-terminal domain-containing protein [Salmonella enterica]|uniref:conjugal transfer protein TraG N-terminal domain-containing protein n=1 Tax=Salmonella enterica TaxID=28901 RepID=UPI0009B0F9AF|nr:conjugal transfer protein TraG N-terminal domain-containing protein [Salmonella enterica]HBD1844096.1 conjugal transfer protein TraG N-terminal domain-containing protein [Salmonella enterica]